MTNRDTELVTKGRGTANNQLPEEERVTAAKKIIQKIKQSDSLGSLCTRMERLAGRLIELANKEVDLSAKTDANTRKMPMDLVNSAKELEDVPVPTVTIPIRPDGRYRALVCIQSFEANFDLVGGLNAPKKMSCRGTDGRVRPMLLKGKVRRILFDLF